MNRKRKRKNEETENETRKQLKLSRTHYKTERPQAYCMDFNRIVFCDFSDLRSGCVLVSESVLLRGNHSSGGNSLPAALHPYLTTFCRFRPFKSNIIAQDLSLSLN